MHLNLLLAATPNPFFPGMWRSPEDESALGYRQLKFWRDLVGLAEGAMFDAVIFERTDAVPRFDSMMLMSALAASTSHIGLVTSPDAAALPAALVAEQLGSLDHLTDGRMGWRIDNIASSAVAEAVSLWEDSWDDDAMVFDTAANEMLRDAKVRVVPGGGRHPLEPSRQRTPALFAEAHAPGGPALGEVLLMDPVPVGLAASTVESILDDVDAADRSFDEVRLVMTARILVGADQLAVNTAKRHVDRFAGEGTSATMPLVGTPTQVADRMQEYLDAGIHGFSLVTTPLPSGVAAISRHLVPVLQDRDLLRVAYKASTLREHYFGYGNNRLLIDHPARRAR